MPTPERFTELLNEFAACIGQAEMPTGEHGVCSFLVDERVLVNIGQDSSGNELIIFAPLGAPPEEHHSTWQVRMLRANGAGGGAYVLGMAPASDTAIISSRRPLVSLNGPALANWVEEFVGVAKHWLDAFARKIEPEANSAAMPADAWLHV